MKLSDENNINSNNDLDRGVLLEEKPKTKKPSMYNVLLLNDDYTPMEFVVLVLESVFNKKEEEIIKRTPKIPTKRLATPNEIATALFWLGSEENHYITGQTIPVSGGE